MIKNRSPQMISKMFAPTQGGVPVRQFHKTQEQDSPLSEQGTHRNRITALAVSLTELGRRSPRNDGGSIPLVIKAQQV
jgi:hypothetical protein